MNKRQMTPLDPQVHDFNPDYFGTVADLRVGADGRRLHRLMVACSDHGNAPDNTSLGGGGPGQFYVVQNLAASIPACDESREGTILGSIEYAIVRLKARDAIVCGHAHCGVIHRWMQADERARHVLPSRSARRTWELVNESYGEVSGRERTRIAIREHILSQLEILQSYDFVRSRLEDGRLRLHGWLVDDATACVRTFDPDIGQFVACEAART